MKKPMKKSMGGSAYDRDKMVRGPKRHNHDEVSLPGRPGMPGSGGGGGKPGVISGGGASPTRPPIKTMPMPTPVAKKKGGMSKGKKK